MSLFKQLKIFLELCRVSNLPTVWTNVLAAFVLSGTEVSWIYFLILSLSMSLFYSAGMCLNDISDAAPDLKRKPFRPLPSGRLSVRSAWFITVSLFTAALSLLLAVPDTTTIYAGLILVAAIWAYDRFHKATPMMVFMMATCRLMIFVTSSIGLTGMVKSSVLTAGIIQFLYTLLISVAARLEGKRESDYRLTVIPMMIAGISMIDGIVMAYYASPVWLLAGIVGAILTMTGQALVRGD